VGDIDQVVVARRGKSTLKPLSRADLARRIALNIHPLRAQAWANTLAQTFPDFFEKRVQNPVFIIGCGRSGTTLMVDTLADHPQIANYPDEANELWHPQTFPWRNSKHKSTLPPIEVDSAKFTRLSLEYRTPAEVKHMRAVFGAFQTIVGRPVFLNKSAMVTFMIPFLLEQYPEAKLIHLIRDGRAVALSWAKKVKKIIEEKPEDYEEVDFSIEFNDLLRNCSRSWREHIEEVERQKKALNLEKRGILCEFRYEDFCTTPRDYLEQLASFIGISPEPYRRKDLTHISSANYKFKMELDEPIFQEMMTLMEPALRAKGYL
jgi:hypothetical protein